MAGASLDINLEISNAAEVKAVFEALQTRLADLTPVFQDIGEAMLNSTRKRFEDSVAPDGTKWKALSEATLIGRARRANGGHLTDRRFKNEMRWTKKAAMAYAYAKPLIDRGSLMGTLNYQAGPREVRIGTPLIYGATFRPLFILPGVCNRWSRLQSTWRPHHPEPRGMSGCHSSSQPGSPGAAAAALATPRPGTTSSTSS